MKVGTDGVLLGSWVSLISHPFSILDIGAGTGLISLMLAQRSNAQQIDAIEIDAEAYEQCVDNFEDSPWNDRLFCFHASLDEFAEEMKGETYDLIVSNPPYFSPPQKKSLKSDISRNKARFYDSLPFEHLIENASQLLADSGIFSVIIPFDSETAFISLSKKVGLYPQQITRVRGTANSAIKRSLILFGFEQSLTKTNELTLEISRHQYTEEFKSLVKDFYLHL